MRTSKRAAGLLRFTRAVDPELCLGLAALTPRLVRAARDIGPSGDYVQVTSKGRRTTGRLGLDPGASVATVRASASLEGSVSGSPVLEYLGGPVVSVTVTGSSILRDLGG